MKLAEILRDRADLNVRIAQLRQRLANSVVVQEGESPPEAPDALLAELDADIEALRGLITLINDTNNRTLVNGRSLTALIAERDCLTLKLSVYRDVAANAGNLAHRATRTEIKLISAVNVRDIQKTVDGMAKQLRELDNTIQAANWNTEV